MNNVYGYGFSYLFYILPGIILAIYAQGKISSAYSKYLDIRTKRRIRGYDAARMILDANGMRDVRIEEIPGKLTDNYDPRDKTLHLSKDVYHGDSLASVSIAAHEVGHAMQDNTDYFPLRFRASLVPLATIGTNFSFYLIVAGFFFSYFLTKLGIALFFFGVLFQIVTLPVEFNASNRAKIALEEGGYLDESELKGTREVLSAAALTYIAATLTALGQFLRLLAIFGNRRDWWEILEKRHFLLLTLSLIRVPFWKKN